MCAHTCGPGRSQYQYSVHGEEDVREITRKSWPRAPNPRRYSGARILSVRKIMTLQGTTVWVSFRASAEAGREATYGLEQMIMLANMLARHPRLYRLVVSGT